LHLFFRYILPKKMRERFQLILKFLVLVFAIGFLVYIWKALPIISGYAAKVACSGIFLSGRPQERVLRDDLASFPVNLASCTVDMQDSSVTATVLGLASRKAVYRWRLGATLVNGMTPEALREQHMVRPMAPVVDADTVDWPMGDRVHPFAGGLRLSVASAVAAGRTVSLRMEDSADGLGGLDAAKLQAAMGSAFGEGGSAATGTRAVVVVWHGQLVAERYAPGFTPHTRFAGWSMAKGIVNALTGILVGQRRLNTGVSAPVPEWAGDGRRVITIADLLHMNSGLRWWEFYGGPSDATNMLFKETDMSEFAARAGLSHPPGLVFSYSSGTANILSGIIRRTVGDDYYYRFPYEQLFYKTGMYSAVLEPDAGGTFVGSSYCYATARDWARFGLLYLHDGVWAGQRILPEGWVKWTTTGGGYGALWWLNKDESAHRRHPQLPKDCYSCEGYEGQYVWVIPSMDLVVVRMAMEHGPVLDPDVFVPAVMKALQ
jgi:CubicO group peptidase (beta-lactamase class C family)